MTKISVLKDENNIVKSYGIFLVENINPLLEGEVVETDIDFDNADVNLVNNYKLVDEKLVELTEEEKAQVSAQ